MKKKKLLIGMIIFRKIKYYNFANSTESVGLAWKRTVFATLHRGDYRLANSPRVNRCAFSFVNAPHSLMGLKALFFIFPGASYRLAHPSTLPMDRCAFPHRRFRWRAFRLSAPRENLWVWLHTKENR